MPRERPEIGELWRMRDLRGRESHGVVADVAPTQITLVSFTGNRTRLSPTSFNHLWSFSQGAPRTGIRCSRRSCPDHAVFRSQRDGADDYVCARHVPVGLQAEYLRDAPAGLVNRSYVEVICPSCASLDPTEDRGLPNPVSALWSWWTCHLCGRSWITIAGPQDLAGVEARGRWYHTQITSALAAAEAIGDVDRIEGGRGAVGDIRSTPTHPWTVRLALEIEPAVVHVVLRRRPIPAVRSRRIGVQHLGGPSYRSDPISNVVPIRPEAPPPPPVQVQPEINDEATRPETLTPLQDDGIVSVGSYWRQTQSNEVVEVIERLCSSDGRDLVRLQKRGDAVPSLLVVGDFITSYVPTSTDVVIEQDLYESIHVAQEWRDADGHVVVVQKKHDKRRVVTVTTQDGGKRSLTMRDFHWMKPIVRRTAYERLRILSPNRSQKD